MATASSSTPGAPRLRRTLTLWDLILYGVIVIQPVAPLSVFGVLSDRGRGHVVTTVLIAMVAMLFTAISYGRMARAYPSAGSAFTYVGQEINPALGYVTGWSMVMDYMLNPMICIIWCSKAAQNFLPEIPYPLLVVLFAVFFTLLNLNGVETSARINAGMAAALGIVIVLLWHNIPITILIVSAVAAAIPRDVVEAARNLGASPWQVFGHVIVPLCIPGISAAALLVFIDSFGTFAIPSLIGPAFPRAISVMMTTEFLQHANWGLASALGVVMIVTTAIVLVLYYRLLIRMREQAAP